MKITTPMGNFSTIEGILHNCVTTPHPSFKTRYEVGIVEGCSSVVIFTQWMDDEHEPIHCCAYDVIDHSLDPSPAAEMIQIPSDLI